MCTAVNWGLVALTAVIAGPAGFFLARALSWWHKLMTSTRIRWPVFKRLGIGVGVVVLLGMMWFQTARGLG